MTVASWVFFGIFAVAFILLGLSLWLNLRKFPNIVGSILMLALSTFLLIVIFSVRPVRLVEPLTHFSENPSSPHVGSEGWKLLEMEHQKAIDEIEMRIRFEDEWFHIKFILVGGLLAGFLAFLGMTKGNQEQVAIGMEVTAYERRLGEIFQSNAASSVLALACVISTAIDMHVRNNIIVVQQLALWIARFLEPVYIQLPSGFVPWEQFLRIETPGAGMHRDDLYGFIFYPHLHFLTWVLYVLYLITLLKVATKRRGPEQDGMSLVLFILVHVSLGALTGIGHAAPSAFEYKIVPYIDWWVSGWQAVVCFYIPWLLLILVTLPIARRFASALGRVKPNS